MHSLPNFILGSFRIIMSVIATVSPGFEVLYAIIDSSTTGDEYANFIRNPIDFTRKKICNRETEIAFIEDKSPINGINII